MEIECEIKSVGIVERVVETNDERVGLISGTVFENGLFCSGVVEFSMGENLRDEQVPESVRVGVEWR